MKVFAKAYPDEQILQQPVAKLPWGHNIILLEKVKDETERFWYIQKTIEHGWSRNVLVHQINTDLYRRLCSGTTCTITRIYDQTANHNDLTISWGGFWHGPGPNGSDLGADAMALPVTVAGHQAFGIKVTPGVGYRIDDAKSVAIDSQPEGIYMVTSPNNVNSGCCFDYGSGETSHTDTGVAHMNAIYWGHLMLVRRVHWQRTVGGSRPGEWPVPDC